MKKHFSFIILSFLFITVFTHPAFAESTAVTGFVPGQIWYSSDPLVEGDTVKVYTAIWNGDVNPLSAHVEFYDKNTLLGFRDVVISPSQLKDVSVSWKVTSGDHVISAKITSSSFTISGKKQDTTVGTVATGENKLFVSPAVKTVDGVPASSTDVIKTQVDKIASNIENIVPESISEPISSNFNSFDTFRAGTYKQIATSKEETKEKIKAIDVAMQSPVKTGPKTSSQAQRLPDPTEKPIAYIKLFFLSVLSFIFRYKLIFYGLLIFLLISLLRYLYRKIRNR